MSLCYTNSDAYEGSLCMGKGVREVFWSFLPPPVLFSLSVRTGWTGFEPIPSIQPSVFCVFF